MQSLFCIDCPLYASIDRDWRRIGVKSCKGAVDIMSSDGLKAMEVTADKVNLKSFMFLIPRSLILC